MLKDLYNPLTAVNVTNSVVHTYSNNESSLNTTLNDGIDQLTFLFPTENIIKFINHFFFPKLKISLVWKTLHLEKQIHHKTWTLTATMTIINTICPSIP